MRILLFLSLIVLTKARSLGLARAIQPMFAGEERRFDCEFTDFGRNVFGSSPDRYSCIVETGFMYTIANVIGTNGDHSGGRRDSNVESLIIEGVEFAMLPTGVGSVFPNLVVLHVAQAGLTQIRANDIRVFPSLEILSLPENEILFLQNNFLIYENNPELRYIDLSFNTISYVDEEFYDGDFEDDSPLDTLLMEGNICDFGDEGDYDDGNVEEDEDLVWDLIDVLTSDCSDVTRLQSTLVSVIRNYITDLEECYGDEYYYYDEDYTTEDYDCEELAELVDELEGDLDSCEGDVEDLEEEVEFLKEEIYELNNPVDGTCRFKETEDGYACSGNMIELTRERDKEMEWEGDHEGSYTDARVRVFLLRYQVVVYLPIGVADYFQNIQTYIVDSCGLEEIQEDDFEGLEGITKLVLSGNDISSIDSGVLDGLEDLEELDLSDNGITNFPRRLFSYLGALEILDISGNRITVIRSDMITSANGIVEFYAGDNRIENLDVTFLWKLKNAEIVDFSDNPCDVSYDVSEYDEDNPTFKEFLDEVVDECS